MSADCDVAVEIDPLDRARRHIDSNFTGPLTLSDLATAAGLSAYHFTRQFGARFGASQIAYVRAKRMADAALRLRSAEKAPIVDLAFDCGFDSQEGFTRAFKRAFGVSPGRYRREACATFPKEITTMSAKAALTQSSAPMAKSALRLAGFSEVFDDATKAEIPHLWDRLLPLLPIPGQSSAVAFGVCAAGPVAGAMRYTAGVPIALDAPTPDGLEVIELPSRDYLIFRQELDGGPLHPQMQLAAKEIWGERLPSSGHRLAQAPDLEFYPEDFRPDQPGAHVEWWIPVEPTGVT